MQKKIQNILYAHKNRVNVYYLQQTSSIKFYVWMGNNMNIQLGRMKSNI